MKSFVKSKTMIAVISMVFFVLACGTAMVNAQEVKTKVEIKYDSSIWDQKFMEGKQAYKPAFMGVTIFNKATGELVKYCDIVHKADNGKMLGGTVTGVPAGEKLKVHLFINASAGYNLKQIDKDIVNDGKDKTFVLEDLLKDAK